MLAGDASELAQWCVAAGLASARGPELDRIFAGLALEAKACGVEQPAAYRVMWEFARETFTDARDLVGVRGDVAVYPKWLHMLRGDGRTDLAGRFRHALRELTAKRARLEQMAMQEGAA